MHLMVSECVALVITLCTVCELLNWLALFLIICGCTNKKAMNDRVTNPLEQILLL